MADQKPGWKTTEFWTQAVGVVVLLVPVLLTAFGGHPVIAAIIAGAMVALPAVYIWGRAILKAEQAKQTNIIPDSWEPLMTAVFDGMEKLANALPKPAPPDDNG